MSHTATSMITPRDATDVRNSSASVVRKTTGSRSGESDPASDAVALAAAPFDALLTTLQASRRSQRMLVGGQASPQEMFEPRASDVHQQRLETLRTDDRAALNRQWTTEAADQSTTPTRQAPGPNARAQLEPLMRNPPAIASNDPIPAKEGMNGRDILASDWRAQVGTRGDGASEHSGRTPLASSSPSGFPTIAEAKAPQLSRGSENFQNAAITGTGASPPKSGSDAASTNPAEQIGRILSAGRVGDNGLSRSPAGPTTTRGEARPPPPRFAETHSGATASDAGSASPGSEDVEAVPRSPFDALVRAMRLNAGAQYSSARMWLEPPELGRMQVDVRVHGRQVRIGVRTETAAARRIVAERAAELTDALRRHGITIEELEVTTVPDDESLTDVANPAQATPRGRLAAVDRSSRWPETNHGAATPDQPKTGKDNQGLVVAAESRLDVRA